MKAASHPSQRPFVEWLRHFNKAITNRITLRFAGKRIYANIHHVGRRSGRHYQTPVFAVATEQGFVIPLPYGENVDWCRNVMAAGGCQIEWRRSRYTVCEPSLIPPAQALPYFPGWMHRLLRHTQIYLEVKRLEA